MKIYYLQYYFQQAKSMLQNYLFFRFQRLYSVIKYLIYILIIMDPNGYASK